MTKIIKKSFLLVLLFSLFCLVGCQKEHVHNMEFHDKNDATCQKEGNIAYYECLDCHKLFLDDKGTEEVTEVTIPITSHNMKLHDENDATCINEGNIKYYECQDCHKLFLDDKGAEEVTEVTIPVSSHNMKFHDKVDSTCQKEGNIAYYECVTCHKLFNDQNGNEIIEDITIEMKKHVASEWITDKEATCEEDGIKHKECTSCHTKLEDGTIPALHHDYGNWTHEVIDGIHYHTHVCKNDENHKESVLCQFTTSVEDATCTTKEILTHVCETCEFTYTEDGIDALGHNYQDVTWVFVTEGGETEQDEHTHYHTRICKRCEEVDKQPCKFVVDEVIEPTCTTGGFTRNVCEECGGVHEDTLTNPTDHKWSTWHYDATKQKHIRICENNPEHQEEDVCSFETQTILPTCEDDGYDLLTCLTCQHEERRNTIPALGHDYDEWVYDGDSTPEDNTKHTHTHVCKRDKTHTETKDCVMVETVEAGNCFESEEITTSCKDCHISFTREGAKSLGHKWGKWEMVDEQTHKKTCENDSTHEETNSHQYKIEVNEPTCLENGLKTYTCLDCEYQYTEEIPALTHLWGEWQKKDDTEHIRICQHDENHIETDKHKYTTNNYCDDCHEDGLVYIQEGGHYKVGKNSEMTCKEIIIPSMHNGYPVKAIGSYAFRNSKIEKLTIASSVEEIEINAFLFCEKLQEVKFENDESNLKIIGMTSFQGCKSLVSFDFPVSLLTIDYAAFYGCTSLNNIDLKENVDVIGTNAFYDTAFMNNKDHWVDGVLYLNNHLIKADAKTLKEKYEILDGTVSISDSAFIDCTNLKELILPSSLLYIDYNVFKNCTSLNRVEYKGKMSEWFNIHFLNEYSNPLHYADEFHIDDAEERINIPEGVTSIPSGTFRGTNISSVIIPSTVTSIGAEAFKDCTSLKDIKLPDNLIFIGKDAFLNCGYYQEKTNWTNGLLYLDSYLIAANNDEISDTIKVNDGTKLIISECFINATNLVSITLPKEISRILANTFSGCTKLNCLEILNVGKNWFCNSSMGIGRVLNGDEVDNPTRAARTIIFYSGEWRALS